MLQVHYSNRYEQLRQALLSRLDARPRDLFLADQVIVPSAAVRRSLTLALADEHGICAQVEFSFLASWLWQQTSRLLPGLAQRSPFASEVTVWRVHAALGDARLVSAHPRLAHYLRDADEVMRFDLATRVAGVLQQYRTYRPEWIEAWARGDRLAAGQAAGQAVDGSLEDEHWQAELWRRIVAQADAPLGASPADLVRSLALVTPGQARAAGLPATAHVFVPPSMPAQHVAWLQQLGRLMELHVYVLNPCREFWFDVVGGRQLSRLAARGRAELLEEGNPLLAAWGQQTQVHLHQLVDAMDGEATEDDRYLRHEEGTLLAAVQNSVLELTPIEPGSIPLAPGDRSIEVHVCHSLTRELEVLQDYLLGLFAQGTVDRPSQILVVTPDLDAAAPLVDAVFGTAPADRRIPYSLSGRKRSAVNAPARALLDLLALAQSRFTATEVFAFLQQDIVRRRFDLDAAELDRIHDWLLDCGARWGLDGLHRQTLGLPATASHAWSDGLERLLLGYALPSQPQEPFADMLPAGDAEGTDATILGTLLTFLRRLRALHAAASSAHSPRSWEALVLKAMSQFLLPEADELDEQRALAATVRELVEAMEAGGLEQSEAAPVSLSVLRAALERALDDPARGGVPRGEVTFTSMSSLRSLPFDVVCVVGLNDRTFPGSHRPEEFDLVARLPRPGDRERRIDDRNVFLDLLLAARKRLYLSYVGRSVRDNSLLTPSVLVSELLDVLVPAIAQAPGDASSMEQARARLVVLHPLQPFGRAAFDEAGDPRLRSFNREMAQALRTSLAAAAQPPALATSLDAGEDPSDGLPEGASERVSDGVSEDESDDASEEDAEPAVDLPAFFTAALPAPSPAWRRVPIDRLARFLANPQGYWLEKRLRVHLERQSEQLEDNEPFVLDELTRLALAQRLLGPLLQGADDAAIRRLAAAGRELPAGTLGQQQLEGILAPLRPFAQVVRGHTQGACLPPRPFELELDLHGETWTLAGSLTDLRPQGIVRWSYGKRSARTLLEAWVTHLTLCAVAPSGVEPRTRWIFRDEELVLGPVHEPQQRLRELIALYRKGLSEPLAFFPKAAWALVGESETLERVRAGWTPGPFNLGAEGAHAACQLAFRGHADPLGGEFPILARQVFGPVLACLLVSDVAGV